MKHSRRRYQESIKYLKSAIANPALSWAFRRRCVELLLAIYGVSVPEAGGLERRTVKALLADRAADKAIQAEVKARVLERVRAEAEHAENEAEAANQQRIEIALAQLNEVAKC